MSISFSPLFALCVLLISGSTLLLSISISQYVWFIDRQIGKTSHTAWNLIGIAVAVLILGMMFSGTSYYDYFILNIGVFSLVVVWLAAGMLSAIPRLLFEIDEWTGHAVLLLGSIVMACMIIVYPATLTNQITAIMVGSQADQGMVEEKYISSGRASTAYATINGVEYTVPDRSWFATLQYGQEASFAHDPAREVAFNPTQPGLTVYGIVSLIILGLLWLVTIGCIISGLMLLRKRRLTSREQYQVRGQGRITKR